MTLFPSRLLPLPPHLAFKYVQLSSRPARVEHLSSASHQGWPQISTCKGKNSLAYLSCGLYYKQIVIVNDDRM